MEAMQKMHDATGSMEIPAILRVTSSA
jgi:hypothetical protein